MTDNEIIKALEICLPLGSDCSLCPLLEETHCYDHLLSEVLDLFNRQKAEIEKKDTELDILIRKNETLKDENFELSAEVERKTTECERLEIYMDELVKQKLNQAKAEAIKEFAERLKGLPSVFNCEYEFFHCELESLAKELTE